MKFSEFDVVKLLKDHLEVGLKNGDIGAVLLVYEKPHEAYEVEFINNEGRTLSLLTLLPEELEKV